MKRKFEVISSYKDKEVKLPIRHTKGSAGYDFFAVEDFIVPSIWTNKKIPTIVPTGVKAYMFEFEFLDLRIRSSLAKKGLMLPNAPVIDSDYVDNAKNEGHIMFMMVNIGLEDIVVKKGEHFAQGIFLTYRTTDEDEASSYRTGGFGSTTKK
jgi:dUTP pyrophosphatase